MSRGLFLCFQPPVPCVRRGVASSSCRSVNEKKKNIFLNTELIFKWPKRDFISTPKLFPLGDVHLGAGALPALGCSPTPQPAGRGAAGSGCVSCAGMNFTRRGKILICSEDGVRSVSHLNPCKGKILSGTRTLRWPAEQKEGEIHF